MRITIVQGAFFPVPPIMGGAVEKAWHALGKEFARQGHAVTHISRQYPQLPKHETVKGVVHCRVPGFDTPRSAVWLKALDLIYSRRVLRRLPAADIIVTNTFWLPMLLRSTHHGRVYVHVARYPKGQMRLYRHAARLQAVSGAVAEAIRQEAPKQAQGVSVIPYPLPLDAFIDRADASEAGSGWVYYAGRVHAEKGLELLVRAFVYAASSLKPRWRLRLVGPWQVNHGGAGPAFLERLRDLARPLGNRFEFQEAVFDEHQLRQLYAEADLFVYPSLAERGESFGLAPLEAMAAGCPPLVSDLACFRDFITDNITGFVFDHRADDPVRVLAERLKQLTDEPRQLRETGRRANARSLCFALPKVAAMYLDDFQALLST